MQRSKKRIITVMNATFLFQRVMPCSLSSARGTVTVRRPFCILIFCLYSVSFHTKHIVIPFL